MSSERAADGLTAWSFRAEAPVTQVAVSPGCAWAAVADAERTVTVLEPGGRAVGRFKAGQPVRRLCIDDGGTLFTALAGDSIVYAFNRNGELDWRVEFGGPVADFAMAPAGTLLAGVSDAGWLYTYSPEGRERRVMPVGRPMTCLALLDGEDPRLVVAGPKKTKLCLLAPDGKPRWEADLGGPARSISVAEGPGLVAAVGGPAVKLFSLDGAPAGLIKPPEAAVRAELTPDGARAVVETVEGRLLTLDLNSRVIGEHELAAGGAPWALGAEGTLIVAASEADEVSAAPLAGTAPSESAALPDWPERLQVEGLPPRKRAAEPPAAPPSAETRCRVVWKKQLPGGVGSVAGWLFRLSTDGRFLLCGLEAGLLLGLSAEGDLVVREEVEMPARALPRALGRKVVVVSGDAMLVVDTGDGSCDRASIEGPPLVEADCPEDAAVIYGVDEDGRLAAFGQDGIARWRKDVTEPTGLIVSADGSTIAVSCGDGRFRYYDADGRLMHKSRFSDGEEHQLAAVSDEFSVFQGQGGKLTVTDAQGRRLWSRQVLADVTHLELLGSTLAVYGPRGACGIVEPLGGEVHELHPPPGLVRARAPLGADVVVVQAAGTAVTAFRGFRRKLGVAWRHDCGQEVTLLDVAWNGRVAAAVAGRKVFRIEGDGA